MEFEVFKTGTHTDTNGTVKDFTEADLDFIASSYNPQLNEAPIVIGHPKNNAPAYGWVESLRRSGQTLFAKVSAIVPEFLEALKQGLFKKRSIALNSDGTLRHVGFLGAVPPAVKGLKDLEFSDYVPAYEFSSVDEQGSSVIEQISDNHINPDHPSVQGPLQVEESTPTPGSLSIPSEGKSPASEFASSSAQEDAVRQKVLDNIEKLYFRQRRTEFEIYLNEKLAYGNVTPAMKTQLLKLLEALSAVAFNRDTDAYVFEFSDESKEDPLNILKAFIDSLPKVITFEEVATKPLTEEAVSRSEFSGFSLDSQSLELHEKITRLSKKENIPYVEALHKLKSN